MRADRRRAGRRIARHGAATSGLVLALALAVVACAPPEALRPPDEDEVRAVLVAALSSPSTAGVDPSHWAAGDMVGESARFRAIRPDEAAALWRPGPYAAVRIEAMNCRFYPVWRVTFRPAAEGEPRRAAGPPLVAEIVPRDAVEGAPASDRGAWLLLGRWWPARPDDPGQPDFRPRGRARPTAGEGVFVTAWPTWAVPSQADAGFGAADDDAAPPG